MIYQIKYTIVQKNKIVFFKLTRFLDLLPMKLDETTP